MNKKILLISILFLLIFSGAVLANQKNNYVGQDNKDLLKEFASDEIGSAQVNENHKQESLKNYGAQAVLVDSNNNNDSDDDNQKLSFTQELELIAKIGENLFGIEKKKFFQPLNKIVGIKNYQAPKIINVPEDYSVIQEAIDNANFGDTIKVASGEYQENIIMKEGVSLIGSNELEEEKLAEDTKTTFANAAFISSPKQIIINETIINGENSGNVISFKNGITNKTILFGFTIKNSGKNLNGIFIENSSPLITDNVLEDNEYGVYIKENSSPVIQKNIMRFNNKGIQIYSFEKPENFSQEEKELSSFSSLTKPILIDNLITDNKIGIDLYQSSALIEHNTISYNNHYKTYLGATHGIHLSKSSAEIKNNIITDNGICELCSGINADETSADIIISYNNIWNNKNNFVCFGQCIMEDNNISEDPLFVNYINGDYKLSEESGLIGACEDGSDVGVRW